MRSDNRFLTTAAALALWACCVCPATLAAQETLKPESKKAAVPVVLSPATQRTFVAMLRLQGTVLSKETLAVGPNIPGTLTEVFVDAGDRVVAGETKLMISDPVKAGKALEIARQDLALAECGKREAAANLVSQQVQLDKAEIDLQRFTRLREKQAVTQDMLEQQTARRDVLKAAVDHAKTMVDLSAEQHRKAQFAIGIAEKTLEDTLVVSPITGVISHRILKRGEMGDAGKPVVIIEDISAVDVSLFAPADCYARVHPNETKVKLKVAGRDLGEYPVTFRSPVIESKLRTFEIKCRIPNPPEEAAPGALADAEIVFETRQALGVPGEAVQERGGKTVVFVEENQRVRMVPIAVGLESDGWKEIRAGEIAEGAHIVRMGQFLLEDGAPVSIQEARAGESG